MLRTLRHLPAAELLVLSRASLVQGHRHRHHDQHSRHRHHHGEKYFRGLAVAGAGAALATGLGLHLLDQESTRSQVLAEEAAESIISRAGRRREGLPEYSTEEVGQHDCREKRIWVIFKSGVYDITDFVPLHPGAEKLLMAAGRYKSLILIPWQTTNNVLSQVGAWSHSGTCTPCTSTIR